MIFLSVACDPAVRRTTYCKKEEKEEKKKEIPIMTFDKVKEIIMDTINCDEEKISLDASLKEDLDMDSLDAMELSMALEEEYEITIEEEELQNFVTVRNIVDYIDKVCA